MKPTQEQVITWAREAGFKVHDEDKFMNTHILDTLVHIHTAAENLAALAYEAGRKDENEACASLEVHLITPTRDYTTMSPLDCYEAALLDEAMAFREAIRARVKT
jgi:hypothetical protein